MHSYDLVKLLSGLTSHVFDDCSNIYHYYIHGPQGNVDRSEPSRIQVCCLHCCIVSVRHPKHCRLVVMM